MVYSCYDISSVRYIIFHFHETTIYAMLHRHVKEDGIEGDPILWMKVVWRRTYSPRSHTWKYTYKQANIHSYIHTQQTHSCIVQYSTCIHTHAIQYNTIQYINMEYNTIHTYIHMQYNTIHRHGIQHNTYTHITYTYIHTYTCNTIQYIDMEYNTIHTHT